MKVNQLYILRFVAALLVVFYHYFTKSFEHIPIVSTVFQHGNEAVNFFYILSGFVMVLAYNNKLNKTEDYKEYWINRWARIFPVYVFALLLFLIYYIFIDNKIAHSVHVRFVFEVLFLQSWLGKSSLNYPGWSLSVEMFFYLLFPFLYNRIKDVSTKVLIGIFLLLYVSTQVFYYILHTKTEYSNIVSFVNYAPYLHVTTFYLGMITGIIFTRYNKVINDNRMKFKLAGYLMVVLLCFCFLQLPSNIVHIKMGLLTPIYSIFLFSFAIENRITRFYSNPFFVFLGDISYSIYILQFPIILFVSLLVQAQTQNFMIIYLLILIVVSMLSFYFIEKPFSRIIKKQHKRITTRSSTPKLQLDNQS